MPATRSTRQSACTIPKDHAKGPECIGTCVATHTCAVAFHPSPAAMLTWCHNLRAQTVNHESTAHSFTEGHPVGGSRASDRARSHLRARAPQRKRESWSELKRAGQSWTELVGKSCLTIDLAQSPQSESAAQARAAITLGTADD